MGLTLNDVVTPAGAPETERVTAELKPLIEVTVMVDVSEPPCAIVKDVGEALIEKSGGGRAVIVSEISTPWVSAPLVPVTVNV